MSDYLVPWFSTRQGRGLEQRITAPKMGGEGVKVISVRLSRLFVSLLGKDVFSTNTIILGSGD